MHIRKIRETSQLLTGLRLLDRRMTLSHEDKRSLYKLEKGFEGEELFDSHVKKYLNKEGIILNDLLLTVSGTTIQIDTLLITGDGVRVYEVKNYKGNYQLQSGRFSAMNGQELSSPIAQLNKSLVKLRQLFVEWGIDETVEGSVIFVEPSFFLYHSHPSDPFVFPTQIVNHLTSLNKKMMRLSQAHRHLADQLIQAHQTEAAYEKQLPVFEYAQLKKGLVCQTCGSFLLTKTERTYRCSVCQQKTSLESVVLDNIRALTFLFPDMKLSTSLVYDWCGRAVGFKRVRQILQKNYTVKGTSRGTFYV